VRGAKVNKEVINQLINEVKAENVIIPKVVIEKGALQQITSYVKKRNFSKLVLVVDENTKSVAGHALESLLENEENLVTIVELKPNQHGQVIANEETLVQLLVEMPNDTHAILAIGSGTIHDVVRFVSYKMNIPFISVPTAASVDGFTSKGAPLIFRGFKETIQTASPLAVFVDIDVLKTAPQKMTAAGFGDMIGKYTSLLDWKISHLIAHEPYNKLAATITKKSLEACVKYVQQIAANEDDGLKILMQSLIESGLVMLVLDFSRPASGSEHHLSHYWEMELLKNDEKQLLHGAKVGVALAIIIDLYKQFVANFEIDHMSSNYMYIEHVREHWPNIKEMINELPNGNEVRSLLQEVGGPATSKELNIPDQLVRDSLNEAYHLRDRCTGLLLINQFKKHNINIPI